MFSDLEDGSSSPLETYSFHNQGKKKRRLRKLSEIEKRQKPAVSSSSSSSSSFSFSFSEEPLPEIKRRRLRRLNEPREPRPMVYEGELPAGATYPQIIFHRLSIHSDLRQIAGDITLKKLIKQWSYTGNYEDFEKAEKACELCDHQGLRWHFEIKNKHNENRLNIGSNCIKKFIKNNELAVDMDGHQLEGREASAFIQDHIKKITKKSSSVSRFILN